MFDGAGCPEHVGDLTARGDHDGEQTTSSPQLLGKVADRPAPPGSEDVQVAEIERHAATSLGDSSLEQRYEIGLPKRSADHEPLRGVEGICRTERLDGGHGPC